MNAADPRRKLEEILIGALETPLDQREAYVREACGPDAELCARIWKLVQNQQVDLDGSETASILSGPNASCEGRRIGPYTLHAPIGSGAFGVVYLGTRDDELKRRVAIKILKPSMDPARFRAETQYLALLNHPNIVKVFDFGQTEQGEFYCVMEYVEGQDLTTYCRARRLVLEARLKLFHAICQGVRAVHRVPLVHRDLKPDNIRVTAEGEPKLLDFGLARLLQQELALNIKAPTLPGTAAGTWIYASPEQLRGEPVTTATDIYSLGVILYELLGGVVPLARPGMTLAQFSRAVMEEIPPPPSKAVAAEADGESIAIERQLTHAKALAAKLAGELDAIVSMALRKEPDRRYQSVEAFAADVRAHLDGFPVSARPDSFGYRARKLVRRHRALAVVSCVATVSLTGGLIGMTVLEKKAVEATQVAESSLNRMKLESSALQDTLDAFVQKDVPNLPQLSKVEDSGAQLAKDPGNPAARTRALLALQQLYTADEQAQDFSAALSHCRQAVQMQASADLQAHCNYLEGRAKLASRTPGLGAFGGSSTGPTFDALDAGRNYLALGKLRAAGGDTAGAREAFNRAIVLFGMAGPEAKKELDEARAARDSMKP